jgi:hypothetical protein
MSANRSARLEKAGTVMLQFHEKSGVLFSGMSSSESAHFTCCSSAVRPPTFQQTSLGVTTQARCRGIRADAAGRLHAAAPAAARYARPPGAAALDKSTAPRRASESESRESEADFNRLWRANRERRWTPILTAKPLSKGRRHRRRAQAQSHQSYSRKSPMRRLAPARVLDVGIRNNLALDVAGV